MLTIRFITAGAALAIAASAAAAQTATPDNAPSNPLLQLFGQPAVTTTTTTTTTETTTTKPEPKPVAKRTAKPRVAKKSHHQATDVASATDQPVPAADSSEASASSVWQTGDAAPIAALPADAATPNAVPAFDQSVSELVVGGHTVQVATPDTLNAIDRAADRDPPHDVIPQAAPATDVALAAPDDHARDAWYEEVLATLGGALAAGLLAWFLINAAPARMYG